jgi:hypothetical protein
MVAKFSDRRRSSVGAAGLRAERHGKLICTFVSRLVKGSEYRLCGLVVRGPGFDSRCYQIFSLAVGLERDPLSPREDK